MSRLKLTLAYKGTRFAGWQVQEHPSKENPRTVQGCLEDALQRILGEHRRVQGAGRTDAGVHALGQVAHVDIPDNKQHIAWQAALNHHLPNDLVVVDAVYVSDTFHARYDALNKTYAYTLWLERSYVLPQRSHYVWPVGPLDLENMRIAMDILLGEHDFACFQNTGSDVGSTVRTLLGLEMEQSRRFPEITIYVTASGFLKQMVRNITGCLVATGLGKMHAHDIHALLEQKDRSLAPATAPACGLTLECVRY